MASITIRDIDESVKERLTTQAALHGRSAEEEARDILQRGLAPDRMQPDHLATAINALFQPLGGLDLSETPREPMRPPIRFD
jgi:plasmid stability protein